MKVGKKVDSITILNMCKHGHVIFQACILYSRFYSISSSSSSSSSSNSSSSTTTTTTNNNNDNNNNNNNNNNININNNLHRKFLFWFLSISEPDV